MYIWSKWRLMSFISSCHQLDEFHWWVFDMDQRHLQPDTVVLFSCGLQGFSSEGTWPCSTFGMIIIYNCFFTLVFFFFWYFLSMPVFYVVHQLNCHFLPSLGPWLCFLVWVLNFFKFFSFDLMAWFWKSIRNWSWIGSWNPFPSLPCEILIPWYLQFCMVWRLLRRGSLRKKLVVWRSYSRWSMQITVEL